MPLARLPQPFDHDGWLFELKYDGFRALAHLEAGTVHLVSRKQNRFKSFPGLCSTMAACLQAESAVLDGEIVYLGSDGRPVFYDLMRRRTPQHFCAFDILWLDGNDLRGLPLVKRKQILRRVVPIQPAPLLYADHFDARGVDLFRVVCESDQEGIVAKCKDGRYTPEETSWVKIKNPRYSQAEGREELFEKRSAGA
jgi:bifunctional non-homologous end joining protein LigD